MKNNIFKLIIIFFIFIGFFNANGSEQFNFDVTEIQILENGNKFIGTKRGIVSNDDGVEIEADYFEYNKNTNILEAKGNVIVLDKIKKYTIYSDQLIYKKNDNFIFTNGNSKAISSEDNIVINGDIFEYERNKNIINAQNNVVIENKKKDYLINSDFISFFKEQDKIITKGKTSGKIASKYNFQSKDVTFLKKSNELFSEKKTTITDKFNLYNLEKFRYLIDKEQLNGEKIIIDTNYNLPKSDKFYFSSAIIDLKNQNFIAKDTEIKVHKSIFDNSENDPRIKGVSSRKKDEITTVSKAVFTSCKQTDNCPPWVIEAKEIKHDKNKKQLNYEHAVLKLYDYPVFYFPKFFHPDPTVTRQSGLLKPVINESNVLGSSITLPYYHVISVDSDLVTSPTLFSKDSVMIQNEFRKVGKNFNLITDFGYVRNYKSADQNKKKNISYLFSKFNLDLELEDFNSSKLYFDFEKVTNDTFLKVFDTSLLENSTSLKPGNQNELAGELKFTLNHEEYILTTGISSYENLQLDNNDKYQYALPYYDFNKILFPNFEKGNFQFNSNGNNNLKNTNQLTSQIINNLLYSSQDYFSKDGLMYKYNVNLKNLNSIGKNVSEYKSSPQSELMSIFELNSSIPLKKQTEKSLSYLTPKISFRINPSDMKNHSSAEKSVNTDNIFSINRLGFSDSFEAGRSLTVGLDYKKEMLKDVNRYFELKLATVFRDKEENFLPKKSTLNRKTSNLFGSMTNNFSENIKLNYNFSVDNNFDEISYNDINTTLSTQNFSTTFNFIKELGDMGDQNFLKNTTSYKFDDQNYIKFNTRRNRKLNLTEFYDLVYEYNNDCLVAGIKYKKTYYEDRDLKPTEDLLFTITLFPLTTYEQSVDK